MDCIFIMYDALIEYNVLDCTIFDSEKHVFDWIWLCVRCLGRYGFLYHGVGAIYLFPLTLIDRFVYNSFVDVWACSIVFLFGFQAGTGIQAKTIIGLLTEYRGLSWR